MSLFRKPKIKTTFDDLPQCAQRLVLDFNARWNTTLMVESWAISVWDKYKDFYHRYGGDTLYLLHLMKQLVNGKLSFHLNSYEQIEWIRTTYLNFSPKHGIIYNDLAVTTQFPHFILDMMNNWLYRLTIEKRFHPNWEPLEAVNISPNSIHDSGLWPALMNELREHNLLYILWASNWHGKTTYEHVLILTTEFIYMIAPKFQNPEMVLSVLEEIIVADVENIEKGFLEHIKTCY